MTGVYFSRYNNSLNSLVLDRRRAFSHHGHADACTLVLAALLQWTRFFLTTDVIIDTTLPASSQPFRCAMKTRANWFSPQRKRLFLMEATAGDVPVIRNRPTFFAAMEASHCRHVVADDVVMLAGHLSPCLRNRALFGVISGVTTILSPRLLLSIQTEEKKP